MTTQMHSAMTAHQRMAALSELLPADGGSAGGWRARFSWLARRRKLNGLAAVPDRYRLQFLLFADEAMPGREVTDVAAMAGRLADRTRPPARLLARLPEHGELDEWFRERSDQIRRDLGDLLEAEAR